MIRVIKNNIAIKIVIVILFLMLLFHLLILTEVIPYHIIWGGKMNTISEMYVFEGISIVVTLLMICVFIGKEKLIKKQKSNKLIDGLIGLFLIIFIFNTLGNLLAEFSLEKLIFTPITLLLSVFTGIILKK